MAFPGITASMATVAVLLLLFGRTVVSDRNAKELIHSFPEPSSAIGNPIVFRLSWVILVFILIGYFGSESLDIPVSFIACAGAIALWFVGIATKSSDSMRIVRRTPWLIVVFALAMNLIVYNLHLHGATDWFTEWLRPVSESGLAGSVFGAGILFSLLAAIMNNLPAVLISSLSISGLEGNSLLPFASLIGMSVGAKLTPLGSLATLLWLGYLRRDGIHLGWGQYLKYGLMLTIPVLLISLGALWLQIRLN
jgi:arsenical pump membrane protein